MEGVAGEDTASLPANKEHFLAADLTEYHGGKHFAESSATIIAQLKYSTRHPEEPWTGSRLRKRKGKSKSGFSNPNAVLDRLMAAYQNLLQAGHSRDNIQQKASIQLISNQPLHANLRSLWQDVQAVLRGLGPKPVTYFKLLQNLPRQHHAELDKIYALLGVVSKQGLKSKEFTDFWRILDLSGCGADDRKRQQLAVLTDLASSVPMGERDTFLKLTNLVRTQALPENQRAAPLCKNDVLAELNVFSEKDLFPEPAAFNYPAKPVPTPEALAVATALITGASAHLLAHGAAGVGKSTTVQQVPALLPDGSVVLFYDCYADGKYYNLSTGRHTLRNAIVQLSNELAIKTGLPFLIEPPADKYKLLEYFRLRLEAATQIVAATGGLLVIIIDAADNSIARAYKDSKDDCFVPYLWELDLPVGCRLLMTARTHRRASLQAPGDTVELVLWGFDLAASAIRLQYLFSAASPRSTRRFHERTGGNPRVQEYWLDSGSLPEGSFAAFLHSFRRRGTTAEEIIEDIVRAATVEVPDPELANAQLATLVCLQRPIPLLVFAHACEITVPRATDFCHALKPGILFEDDLIGFRDEDFETQLRVRPATEARLDATHNRLGQHFLPLAATDAYAAQAVAEHMAAASRQHDLIALALDGPSVAFIADSALRLRIERRRLQLALQAAAVLRDEASGARLVILAAESLRANEAVKNLILSDIELAARFGEADSIEAYFPAGTNDPWLGHVHYQLAALYAGQPGSHRLAEQQLTQAHAWVRRYMRAAEHERHHWHIEVRDLANEAEANYWLHGPEVAAKQLHRWRPAQQRLRALYPLLSQLANKVPLIELEAQIRQLKLPLLTQCVALAALWNNGHPLGSDWCAEVASGLLPLLQAGEVKPTLTEWTFGSGVGGYFAWPLQLAELFTHHQLPTEISLLLLGLFPPFPPRRLGRYGGYESIITPLRVACLQAHLRRFSLTGADLFPPPPPKPEAQRYQSDGSYEDNEYRRELDEFIALYSCRAQQLTQAVPVAAVAAIIEQGLAKLYPNRKSTDYDRRNRQMQWLSSAIFLATRTADAQQLLETLAEQAERLVGRYQARQLWLYLSTKAVVFPSYRSLAFRYLEQAANDAEQDSIPVTDRRQILLSCAQGCYHYDEEFSRDFYRRALAVAHQAVGDDVAYRLKTAAAVATQLSAAADNAPGLADRLAGLVEAYHPFVSDADNMPLHETMKAITTLRPAAGAALALRWDLLNLQELDEGIVAVVEAATASRFWHPTQALWLLKLCGDTANISRVALGLLDYLPAATAAERQQLGAPLSSLADWIATNVPMHSRTDALERIITWAEAHQQQQLPAVVAIRQTVKFVESLHLNAGSASPQISHYEPGESSRKTEWEAAADRGDVEVFAHLRATQPYSTDELLAFIPRLEQRILPAQRVALLELLVKFRVSYWHKQEPLLKLLADLLRKWVTYGPVRSWAEAALPRFGAPNLTALTGERDIPNRLEQFCTLPFADSSRAALLLPAVSEQLDSLNAEMLCRIAATLVSKSTPAVLTEFVDWQLARMQQQLEADQKALPFASLLPAPYPLESAPSAVYAQFIWTLCGHPDKRVRWQSIHAARQLLTQPENEGFGRECLGELVRLSRTTTGLLPATEEFYWQGARVWALVLLDRLSDEIPAALLPHVSTIAEHAFDLDFPHAQIRELARRILLRLQQFAPRTPLASVIEQVVLSNRPKSCFTRRGRYTRYDQKEAIEEAFSEIQANDAFEFDSFDVIPYWFKPLGEIFQQSEDKIAALTEHWITTKWGRNSEDCDQNRLSDQRRYDWGLMRHHKESEPTVDDLKMHLTHHALMCAAGALADQYPMYAEDYQDAPSTWEHWLERHLPTVAPHSWLADWRDPVPLRADCWGELLRPWRRRPFSQYREALGLNEPNREGWMVVNGHHNLGKDEMRGNVYVSSVAVHPEGAHALLWALHPVKRNDYSFPTFGLGYSDDDQVPKDLPHPFALVPIIAKEAEVHENGLERHDTAARNTHASYPGLSQNFIATCGLTASRTGKQYTNGAGEVVADCEVWDDDLRDKHRAYNSDAFSSGFRIWIRQDVLLSYLSATDQFLLLQVTLSRNTENRNHDEQRNAYDLGKRRLALLHPTGIFETVAGHCALGTVDSKGT